MWLGNLLPCHSSEQLLAGMLRVDDKSSCELYCYACVCDGMQEEVTWLWQPIYILILANYTAFSVQDNLHACQWRPFYQICTHTLGTSTPSRCFLRQWTIQLLAASKSVSARNECNYVAYTSHLAVLSLQTHGKVHFRFRTTQERGFDSLAQITLCK